MEEPVSPDRPLVGIVRGLAEVVGIAELRRILDYLEEVAASKEGASGPSE